MSLPSLPPGQQLVAADKWPVMGERFSPAMRLPDEPWSVSVEGSIARPLVLTLDELQLLPQVERTIDIHCVTRWSKPGVRFAGVLLETLLAEAGSLPEAKFVSFVARSERGHSTSLSLADALRLGALVALATEGRPLDAEHGGPVRVVTPDRYFYKSLKWLRRIELLPTDRLGHWESTAGYHNVADPILEQRYIAPGLSKLHTQAILSTRDWSRREMLGVEAAGHSLPGLRAVGAVLRNADFRGCDLTGADFTKANLTNAHMETAVLRGAKFIAADLEGANFLGADLRGADLRGASLIGATFCSEPATPTNAMPANATSTATRRSTDARLDAGTLIDQAAIDDLTPRQASFVKEHVH